MKTMETKKVNHVSRRFRRFRWANEAASALEYALVVAVVATGIAAALLTFGQAIEDALGTIEDEIEEAEGAADD